jgi:lysozyme
MLQPPKQRRRCNAAGVAIIKQFESLQLDSYRCEAGVWSIGYGSTRHVVPGMTITEEEAEERLRRDLEEAEAAVERMVRTKITDDQYSALVSLVFNCGEGNIAKSTLIRKVNANLPLEAWAEFSRWVHAGGRISQGLIRRRIAEQKLFKPKPGAQAS